MNSTQKKQTSSSTTTTATATNKCDSTFKTFIFISLSALLLRFVLFYQGFHFHFSNRNEITTPLTNFKRLTEGLHLWDLGLSPYSGSAYHQSPLVLLLFYPFHSNNLSTSLTGLPPQVVFLVVDILIAYLLREITKLIPQVLPKEMKPLEPNSNLPNITAALYLFNPFSIFTCIGMSTIVINNAAIILSLYYSLKGNLFQSVFFVALSSYFSIYPIILLFPVSFILKRHYFPEQTLNTATRQQLSPQQQSHLEKQLQHSQTTMSILFYSRIVLFYLLSFSSLIYLSYTLLGSWEFLSKTYGFTLFVEDLTPNIGLFWYYFIEVFDHFRNFFLFIFQYHVFIYCIPLAIRLKNHPLFYFWALCAIIATFKSYPALGDTALHVSLLPLLNEPLKGVRYSFIVIVVAIYVTVLAPILWQMWIYQGTGNANFYYTINLVFTLAQVLLIVDSLSVLLKLDYVNKINHLEENQEKKKIE
ncbi:hypothetical protein CYY_002318 [Polysphondylium violaceum]|uniref:GPI transamidase subunit PIG-U family protein n=1 Tax=Polysphondylium violaceum TaxID=133409 RepID=A0A8J4Q808_9MYCE|nr:hypothetical protein CYY_002318 [Polysphondylium violaceum]